MRKSAFQVDNLAKEMVKEIELQPEKLVADVTKIGIILLLGFTACSSAIMWLFFFLRDGAHV